jgi:hypothetical protein
MVVMYWEIRTLRLMRPRLMAIVARQNRPDGSQAPAWSSVILLASDLPSRPRVQVTQQGGPGRITCSGEVASQWPVGPSTQRDTHGAGFARDRRPRTKEDRARE